MSVPPPGADSLITRHWPWVVASVAYALVLGQWVSLLAEVMGTFIYGLDDPYIHMSMARSLSADGVFGITPEGFTSSSSSPAWTLLLALLFEVLGPLHDLALWLNVLQGVAVLAIVSEALRAQGVTAPPRFLASLAFVFLTPLPTLAVAGLEHSQHLALALLFSWLVSRACVDGATTKQSALLAVVSLLMVATRYEGAFLVAAAFAVLLLHRQTVPALLATFCGALAPVVYAVVSLAHGWYAVPNSVLLKGASQRPLGLFGKVSYYWGAFLRQCYGAPYHLPLLVLAAATLLRSDDSGQARKARVVLWLYLLVAPVHLTLAKVGYFHRYDAYLVALGLFGLLIYWAPKNLREELWPKESARRALVVALAIFAAIPVLFRAWRALRETPTASKNIFDQQLQMARIAAGFSPTARVALHDIGAVTWFNPDVRIVDIWGLASMKAARAARQGPISEAAVRELVTENGSEIAMVYEAWYPRRIPREWIRVARLTISDNVVAGHPTVSFYGTTLENASRLRSAIVAAGVPNDVAVSFDPQTP